MLLSAYFTHFLTARSTFGEASPFLKLLLDEIIVRSEKVMMIEEIELRRNQLERDKRTIHVTDYGAGSRWQPRPQRQVSRMARSSKKHAKWRKLLFQLLQVRYQQSIILELGTSFGITTAYLAAADSSNRVITFEGCPAIAEIAAETFRHTASTTIQQVIGNIDTTLPAKLAELEQVDVVFFDANHQYEPTLRYFEQCLEKASTRSCFIFDDIYWSEEMAAAWQAICAHPKTTLCLDFFQLGMVFFDPQTPKQVVKIKC